MKVPLLPVNKPSYRMGQSNMLLTLFIVTVLVLTALYVLRARGPRGEPDWTLRVPSAAVMLGYANDNPAVAHVHRVLDAYKGSAELTGYRCELAPGWRRRPFRHLEAPRARLRALSVRYTERQDITYWQR